jgi:hypothetical protein
MVIFAANQELDPTDHVLIDLRDGRVLMQRALRQCDAARLNQGWHERGITTRWQPAPATRTIQRVA